jgi:hypothetical protein
MVASTSMRLRGRRWGIVIAVVLLVATPVIASARLRAALLEAPRAHLTSQPGQSQSEVTAIDTVLAQMRNTAAVACEMAMVAIDHNNWFGDWGDNGNSPLLDDDKRPRIPNALESDAVVEPLMTALRDPDYCVRRTAASLLGRARNARVTERLRGALDDPQPETRALAAFALGSAEEQSAGPKLQVLLRDSAPRVRAAAAWSLGELEYRPAISALADLLVNDQSPRVRRAAARSLGQIAN